MTTSLLSTLIRPLTDPAKLGFDPHSNARPNNPIQTPALSLGQRSNIHTSNGLLPPPYAPTPIPDRPTDTTRSRNVGSNHQPIPEAHATYLNCRLCSAIRFRADVASYELDGAGRRPDGDKSVRLSGRERRLDLRVCLWLLDQRVWSGARIHLPTPTQTQETEFIGTGSRSVEWVRAQWECEPDE